MNNNFLWLLFALSLVTTDCLGQRADEPSIPKFLQGKTLQENEEAIDERLKIDEDLEQSQTEQEDEDAKYIVEEEIESEPPPMPSETASSKKIISLSRASNEPTPLDETTIERIVPNDELENTLAVRKNLHYESGYFKHRPLIFDDPLLEEHGLTKVEPRQIIYSGIRFFSAGFLDPIFRPRHPFRGCDNRQMSIKPGTFLK